MVIDYRMARVTGPPLRPRPAAPATPRQRLLPPWLMQASEPDSSGFFATHPGTADRIEAIRKMP